MARHSSYSPTREPRTGIMSRHRYGKLQVATHRLESQEQTSWAYIKYGKAQ